MTHPTIEVCYPVNLATRLICYLPSLRWLRKLAWRPIVRVADGRNSYTHPISARLAILIERWKTTHTFETYPEIGHTSLAIHIDFDQKIQVPDLEQWKATLTDQEGEDFQMVSDLYENRKLLAQMF